jgi:hypothetical protein
VHRSDVRSFPRIPQNQAVNHHRRPINELALSYQDCKILSGYHSVSDCPVRYLAFRLTCAKLSSTSAPRSP